MGRRRSEKLDSIEVIGEEEGRNLARINWRWSLVGSRGSSHTVGKGETGVCVEFRFD